MENIISELFNIQNNIIKNISLDFKRSLYKDINWNARMITITGARGTGKTTMVLQHYIEKYNNIKKCLYFSADNPLILKNGIYNTVKEYFKYYGECVIIDEIHKQNNWSEEIKALYDSYPDKKFIILGSSKIDILNAKGDLSRRTLIYNLKSLSFREFLILKHNKKIEKISLEKIIENHETIY
jgi:predicted AAA+ superfamily ATPase